MNEPDRQVQGRSVAANTMVMAAGTALSRLSGMVRAALLGTAIGVGTAAANAFDIGNTLPNFFYAILAEGVLNAVLVPQIVRAFARGHGEGYVHRLLTLATLALGVLTALLTIGAGFLVWLFTDAWGPEKTALATVFAYWCLPQVFFYGIYALWSQVLNARKVFGAVMWAPAANNLVSIAGFAIFVAVFGNYSGAGEGHGLDSWGGGKIALLAGTATLGIVVQALLLFGPMARVGLRPKWQWGFRGFGLRAAARMSSWTALPWLVSQIAMWLAIRLASRAQEAASGAVVASNAMLTAALAIYIIPHSLITVALMTALFTRMSENTYAGRFDLVRADLIYGLRTTSAFGFLFSALFVVLALPICRVLQPGITSLEVQALAGPVAALALGLVPLSMTVMLKRVYFALEDGRALLAMQIPTSALFAGFSVLSCWLLPPSWWVIGIALGQSLSFLGGAGLRLASLRDRIGVLGGKSLAWMYLRAGGAAILAGEVGYLLLRAFPGRGAANFGEGLASLLVVGAAITVIYLLALRLMAVSELRDFASSVFGGLSHRFRRSSAQQR